jgi:transaldolase/glucose-6-phosphate isomerase
MNPLKGLQEYGQSVWLDYIRRGLITSGELHRLIQEDGLRGLTSNPSIFEKAIAGSTDYADEIKQLSSQADIEPMALYERLAIRDIQDTADVMRQVYEETRRRDGYVSLEVSPRLAHDTQATIAEARRLWSAVARDNLMIKVPATPEGLPAIRQLISEAININVTLLFSQRVYERVAETYLAGLRAFADAGGDVGKVASVASFFVSRIDTAIDAIVASRLKSATAAEERARLNAIAGRIAIANAKLAYRRYKEIYSGKAWQALAAKGAQTQRLLWASTSTKNPNYRDIMYVAELIGLDTVNTIPPATLDAFRDHGWVRPSLEENFEDARFRMNSLAQSGISIDAVTDQLLKDGVRLFAEDFEKLLAAVAKAKAGVRSQRQDYRLPDDLAASVKVSLEDWRANGKVKKLWARDATLWTGSDEGEWLGWLGIVDEQLGHIEQLKKIAEDIRRAGFSHALLLGMGGSSLCPEVIKTTFGKIPGSPELFVLDSIDPAQVKTFESKVDLASTLFIVSSKSGTTLEPNSLHQYFFERVKQVTDAKEAGNRFIAITDPGSKMQHLAERDGFRHIAFGMPSIGGRYSALSNFGMVPAGIMGVDAAKFLNRTEAMVHACAESVPPQDNPGVVLGTILGVFANAGRDKVTIVTSPGIRGLGAWLEQLLAESTGKDGKGLIPIDQENLGPPSVYGKDRVFIYLRLDSAPDATQDAAVEALAKAGHPVVRIAVADAYDLGQEFFRWEIATAVAGSIIGIDPFDQPDVEASKVATRKLTAEFEKSGALPPEKPIFEEGGIKLFTDARNAATLAQAVGGDKTMVGYLRAHLNRLGAGDYMALLAFIEMNESHHRELQAMRHAIRDAKRVATCLGFGPRFLHSTGQAYKGGPNSGVFIQITCDDAADIPVPGQKYSFGVIKAAQARGDFEVLAERNRRALRVHLGADLPAGLATLRKTIEKALA